MRLIISPCRAKKRFNRWKLHLFSPLKPDVTLIARLTPENKTVLDYFCVPRRADLVRRRGAPLQMTVRERNIAAIDAFRFPDLTFLSDVVRQAEVRER
jgi:hypothetical protein